MEIKYTLEILTKDIQDIEKLVAKLQNYQEGSTLEIDLALAKMRNVYDVLTLIREDMREQSGKRATTPAAEPVPEPPVVEKEPEKPEPPVAEKEPEKPVEPPAEEPAAEESKVENTESQAMKTRGNAEILAEKFLAGSSINENLATSRTPDMDSKVVGKPIDNIGRNIGINDRFLIIRELFGGDADTYGRLVQELDQAGSADAARKILYDRFPENGDHEGVMILAGLVKRRYAGS